MSSSRKKTIIVVVILLLVGIAIWWAIKIVSEPAVGNVQMGIPGPEKNPQVDNLPDQTFKGEYFSFTYPGTYRKLPLKLTGDRLEAVNLIGIDSPRKELSVSVAPGAITDNSAISFRRLDKTLYTEESMTLGNDQSLLFTKRKEGFEKAAFVPHNNLVVSIVLTDSGDRDLGSDFEQVISSFAWKD